MVARGESRGEKRGARPLAVWTPSGVVVVLLGPALSLALTPQLVYETDCEEAARARDRMVLLDMTNLLCCPLGPQREPAAATDEPGHRWCASAANGYEASKKGRRLRGERTATTCPGERRRVAIVTRDRRRIWFVAVGAVVGLAVGILVSVTTDVPFAPEIGLLLGALVGWLVRRDGAR